MSKLNPTAPKPERVLLVAVATPQQSRTVTLAHLEELASLACTLDLQVIGTLLQALDRPKAATVLGKGKLEELYERVQAEKIDIVIFDDELTPSQVRNLEKVLACRIVDRSLLILDIFALRAQTAQAKMQVKLAQCQYLLPRLTRMWTHLSRQRGGTSTRGGAGEKEIETDKRMLKNQIAVLRKRLKILDRQADTQRQQRGELPRVALVGYTNAGKSTLMRRLTKAPVYAKDELFATITSTVRRAVVDDTPYLLTDTVGFIRKLPHTLVACFKTTLDEVRQADVLLHVVDGARSDFEEQIQVVQETLLEIQANHIPTLLVINKLDQQGSTHPTLEALQARYSHPIVSISAATGLHTELLKQQLHQLLQAACPDLVGQAPWQHSEEEEKI